MTSFAKRIFDGLARLQRGAEYAGPGADRQCVIVVVEAARERHQAPGAVGLGEGLRPPSGWPAIGARYDPDLEDPRRLPFQVILGVSDAGACAHHLDVTGLGSTFVAETVLVRHRALPDVRHDFHVCVVVRRKARVGRDLVVVPDAQRAPAHSRGVVEVSKGKVVPGLQPSAIFSCELVEWSAFDHRHSLRQWLVTMTTD